MTSRGQRAFQRSVAVPAILLNSLRAGTIPYQTSELSTCILLYAARTDVKCVAIRDPILTLLSSCCTIMELFRCSKSSVALVVA